MLGLAAESRKPTSWGMMILFPRKRRKKLAKKHNSKSAKADPEDCENTYGIDHFKFGESKHDLSGSKGLLA